MASKNNETNIFIMDNITHASDDGNFRLFSYFENLPNVTIGVLASRIIASLSIIALNVYFTDKTEFSYGVLSFAFMLEPVLMIVANAGGIYSIVSSDMVTLRFAFYSVMVSVITSLENLMLAAVLSNGLLSKFTNSGSIRASVVCIALLYGLLVVASIVLLLLFKAYYDHINIQRKLESPNTCSGNLLKEFGLPSRVDF